VKSKSCVLYFLFFIYYIYIIRCCAIHLKCDNSKEREKCCLNGLALSKNSNFPKLVPLPENIKYFAMDRFCHHFSKKSSYYNNVLSFATIGVDNGKGGGYEKIIGNHAVKINGRTYHTLQDSSKKNAGINYFTFDAFHELSKNSIDYNNKNNKSGNSSDDIFDLKVLKSVFEEIKEINPFAEDLKLIGDNMKNVHINNNNNSNKNLIDSLISNINEKTHHLEIGAVISDMSDGNIIFKYKVKDKMKIVFSNSELVEPLCFPLLFPFGELGYDSIKHKNISFLQYMVCRWLMPESTYDSYSVDDDEENNNSVYVCKSTNINNENILMRINKSGSKFIPTNRFQLMPRVAQYHLVDGISRSIDYKLKWHDKNKQLIFGYKDTSYAENYQDNNNEMSCNDLNTLNEHNKLKNSIEREEYSNSNPSFLAASFHGGPRHLKQLATSALVIVTELGEPTIFLTATCNPLWPEIVAMLLPGQTAFDRPDITVRIFHKKLKVLLENLRNGEYFGNSRIIYELRVIEYQHRGLPHAHLVFKLSDTPERKDDKECCDWIDEWISAELPDPKTNPILHKKVSDHMLHTCHKGVNGCINKSGVCGKGFSDTDLKCETCFDEKGYPIYRKRKKEDLNVVSYHIQILIDWDGHINVAYCGKAYVVLYLYKYLFKGNKKLKIDFDNTKELHKDDEISHYLRGRLICGMDAMWRCFGYQTYPASTPSITLIKVKLPYHLNSICNDGKICDLEIYFRRPLCLHNLTYIQFFDLYDYGYMYPKTYNKRGILLNNEDSIDNCVFNISDRCLDLLRSSKVKTLYIYKRLNPKNSITRMSMVYVYMGEIYYLRLLLYLVPAFSYDELLEYNGIKYLTFQHAAAARNIIKNETLGYDCFKEASIFSSPKELRNLFILLTLQGYPTVSIYDDNELRNKMYEDYYMDINNNSTFQNHNFSNNKLLEELEIILRESDKTLTEFGLPNPELSNTELEREKLKYNIKEESDMFDYLNANIPNTEEQSTFLENVYNAITNKESKIFFLQGKAGSGKTTVAKKIIHFTRSKGEIVLGCAATALAAQVYEGNNFDTFHGLFKYPVIDDMEDIDQLNSVTLNLHNFKDRLELIEAASVIIWDECPSNEYHCFKTVYEYFNGLKGKVIICLGDWRQTAPVVKYGSVADTCKASIINSSVWNLFEVHKLTINMRLFGMMNNNQNDQQTILNQQQYDDMLLHIGEGTSNGSTVIEYNNDISNNEVVDNDNVMDDEEDDKEDLENIYNEKQYEAEQIANAKKGLQKVKIPILKYTNDIKDAINFVYPDQFDCIENLYDSAILCATNKSVDKWNEYIQTFNPEISYNLKSYDSFDLVDDPNDVLKNMINPQVLNEFNENNVPHHNLKLKVNDICFIMRNLHKKDGLTNNTRVKITKIGRNIIRVCTINREYTKYFNIPRIRFNVKLPYGKSYTMVRNQFPLKLAYAMTYNKSQGQELKRCLVDITSPPFVHGHLYVALSRIRSCNNIKIYFNDECLFDENDNIPILYNYVYKSLRI